MWWWTGKNSRAAPRQRAVRNNRQPGRQKRWRKNKDVRAGRSKGSSLFSFLAESPSAVRAIPHEEACLPALGEVPLPVTDIRRTGDMFPSTGRMLAQRQSRRTRMSLPTSLGKGRLSVFFHGRINAQDGTAQGARQQSRRRPRSTVGTSGPACDYGEHGLPFVVLSRICRQPLSSPAIMHPGRMERGCMVPHGEASRRKFCFLSDH